MKNAFTILKLVLLAVLLIGLVIGFLFFRVWQKNERPTLSDSSWNQEEILIGHDAKLSLSISAPWHREITTASPLRYPPFLIPLSEKATLHKGSLSLNGMRTWDITVPFVATDTKKVDGLTATFPIKSTKRISPNSVTVPLSSLTITVPKDIPLTPFNPDKFLTEEKPAPAPEEDEKTEAKRKPWLWVLLLLLLIPLLIFVLKRTGVIKTTPAWEKALRKLDKLDPHSQPVTFYSNLTDILKQYTSDRYSIRARAKTSAEFIQTLKSHPHIPKEQLSDLQQFATLADDVKFADYIPQNSEAPKSLELIRSFVHATTPQANSDSESTDV